MENKGFIGRGYSKEFQKKVLKEDYFADSVKQRVRLSLWAEKKRIHHEIGTSQEENALYKRLRERFHKRIKRQMQVVTHGRVFLLDMYVKMSKMAIEVDGGYHDTPEQKQKDELRDSYVAELGVKTYRVRNENIDKAYKYLVKTIIERHKKIVKGENVDTDTEYL